MLNKELLKVAWAYVPLPSHEKSCGIKPLSICIWLIEMETGQPQLQSLLSFKTTLIDLNVNMQRFILYCIQVSHTTLHLVILFMLLKRNAGIWNSFKSLVKCRSWPLYWLKNVSVFSSPSFFTIFCASIYFINTFSYSFFYQHVPAWWIINRILTNM